MLSENIGIIGAGKMGAAIIKGLLKAGIVHKKQLMASRPNEKLGNALAKETGVRCVTDNTRVIETSDIVLLAVKPQVVDRVLREIAGGTKVNKLIVSIAAGVPLSRIENCLPEGTRVVRVMPNTPCLVGEGAAAFAGGRHANRRDLATVGQIFSSVGIALALEEHQLDAVTALSGSGPAYVFLFIESLIAGGVQMGLSHEVARKLAVQTVLGSTTMARDTGQHLAELRDAVTSPGGTTIAGLRTLEEGAFRATVMGAIARATERSIALGRGEQ
jgi:pyrroline-5-carboxylate reductase